MSNPLQQYFRQPKLYIGLPSNGIYCESGTLDGDATNMAVYGMTGMDEIIIKTPDALLTGESTIKVMESCIPSILNGWDVSVLDMNTILSAIRIATNGNLMGITLQCKQCEEEVDYKIDLMKIIEHYSGKQYNHAVKAGELTIKTKPLSYRQSTDINLRNYSLHRKLSQLNDVEDENARQELINGLWKEFAEVQHMVLVLAVDAIDTPQKVTHEREYIDEFLAKCDKSVIDVLKKHIDEEKKHWEMPKFDVTCPKCQHKSSIIPNIDFSNFFG
jgi:hypothetical protein